MRCAVLTLFLLALLALVAVSAASVPVEAQSTTDIYLTLTAGQGSTEHITGYVRGSYGSIEPSGFNSNGVSGSLSRLTWDDRRKEMRVSLTVIPASPLTAVATSLETVFPCSSSDNRNYTCSDPDDGSPERPWNAGNELSIRLTFTPTGTSSDPAPGSRLPGPTARPERLPVAYGARDVGYGWAVPRIAQDPDGVHIDGSTLYLLDDTGRVCVRLQHPHRPASGVPGVGPRPWRHGLCLVARPDLCQWAVVGLQRR